MKGRVLAVRNPNKAHNKNPTAYTNVKISLRCELVAGKEHL